MAQNRIKQSQDNSYFCQQGKHNSAPLCQSLSAFEFNKYELNFFLHKVEISGSWHDFFSVFAFCWYYRFHIWVLLSSLFFIFHTVNKADVNKFWADPKLIPHLMSILSRVMLLIFCTMLLMSQTTSLCTVAVKLLQFGLHSYREKLPFFGDH